MFLVRLFELMFSFCLWNSLCQQCYWSGMAWYELPNILQYRTPCGFQNSEVKLYWGKKRTKHFTVKYYTSHQSELFLHFVASLQLAVINKLTPEQRAELMFNLLESGTLDKATVNQSLQSLTVHITGGNSVGPVIVRSGCLCDVVEQEKSYTFVVFV